MPSTREKQQGFTIVEIMVVLVITIALTILVISGYSEGMSRFALERTAESFIGDLNRAKRESISGAFYEGSSGEVITGGYGIMIKENVDDRYFLFVQDGGVTKEIDEFKVEDQVRISGATAFGTSGDVKIFFPSDGGVLFNGSTPLSGDRVVVTFSAKRGENLIRRVSIDSSKSATVIYE